MLLKIYVVCVASLIVCETAKVGFENRNGNGRSPSEPSSLKTEIMKYKTSECGGSSSEEDNSYGHQRGNKRRGNPRHKKGSDEDDSDESDENDNKRKKGGRQRNNRGNTKHRGSSFEGASMNDERFGMMERRPPPDDYYNRRPGQGPESYNPWEMNQHRPNNQYPNRGMPNPYPGYGCQTRGEEQDPYGNNRAGNRYNNRDAGNNRWNNRDEENRYNSNRDDRYQTRNRNNYGGNDYEDSTGNRRNKGSRRNNNKRGKHGRKSNKNDSGEECVSQCVFTNMNIMEDDGIPSEAGLIKWAQDKIKNEKLKQAGVKEIRKCFGTLASSDGENSCNFSKSLSACLKLGLDEDKD